MTENLFDQINNFTHSITVFEYLNANIEQLILQKIGNIMIAYIEADYFGGKGGQSGIIWKNGERQLFIKYEQDVINKILRHFNIVAEPGKDEFDTLQLGKHRNTRDWI